MIDRLEGDYYVGRTQYDSPEVDPEVLIPAEGVELQPGTFHNVTITDAEAYELFGALAD
jgi:ribosomal protein S12 methylthiotransferase